MRMDFIAALDPELAPAVRSLPEESSANWGDLQVLRADREQWRRQALAAVTNLSGVTTEDRVIPGPKGGPEVPIRLYRPSGARGPLPCLLYIHGGGMIAGSIVEADSGVQSIVGSVGCVAVSVEYRLTPENPFPAPLDDCYAALRWIREQASEIETDRDRIAVGGASAGGGLAAGLSLLARDRGEIPICFQWLIYPMLDDRNSTPSSRAITDPRVWNRYANLYGWGAYLDAEPGSDGISPYAAPSRATDLSGLPPAYIQVGSQDLFLDEDIIYAQCLLQAGVPVELHVYPGVFHGSEGAVPSAAVSVRMIQDRHDALERALFVAPFLVPTR
jgi:acetyl esterase/lipase